MSDLSTHRSSSFSFLVTHSITMEPSAEMPAADYTLPQLSARSSRSSTTTASISEALRRRFDTLTSAVFPNYRNLPPNAAGARVCVVWTFNIQIMYCHFRTLRALPATFPEGAQRRRDQKRCADASTPSRWRSSTSSAACANLRDHYEVCDVHCIFK